MCQPRGEISKKNSRGGPSPLGPAGNPTGYRYFGGSLCDSTGSSESTSLPSRKGPALKITV